MANTPLDRVEAALVPLAGLAVLAGERCRAEVQVVVDDRRAWVTWPAGAEAVWRPLLAAPGATFFEQRGGRWYALGMRLPRFDVPLAGPARPLDTLLFPAPARAEPVPPRAGSAVRLRVVPGGRPRPATALRAELAALLPWVESAPSGELRACRGAMCATRVMLRGPRLPAVAAGQRFWGERVLIPLGFRAEPDLPETALRAAAEVSLGELLVLTEAGAEAIPESAFERLSRAALRRAAATATPLRSGLREGRGG